jgi:mRNA interferase HigB
VRIVALKALRDFWTKHPRAEGSMTEWYEFVRCAQWRGPQDVKCDFAAASFVANNRIVFNVGGNKYRVVVVALFRSGALYIRFVGTHAEYARIDVTEV